MNMDKLKEEITLQLIKIIQKADHKITQRELAKRVGISLGKINTCMAEMVDEECRCNRIGGATFSSNFTPPHLHKAISSCYQKIWAKLIRPYEPLRFNGMM